MIFGEYIPSALSAGDDFYDYLNSGMRLLNQPLYNQLNSVVGGSSAVESMDQARIHIPPGGNCDSNGNFSSAQGANMPQTQDSGTCCPANEGMEDAYLFMHEGLPGVYSDGYNHNFSGGTPIVSYANFLGEYFDNTIPDICYLHNQVARGGTWSRWSDANIVAFERYDYREGNGAQPQTQDVALLALNTLTGNPADISFDDGVSRTSDGYYLNPAYTTSTAVSNSRNVGLAVGFAPGSVLVQLASSSPTGGRAYQKLLVHAATSSWATASNSANASDPTQRLIYIGGQTISPAGGGAIELTIPSAVLGHLRVSMAGSQPRKYRNQRHHLSPGRKRSATRHGVPHRWCQRRHEYVQSAFPVQDARRRGSIRQCHWWRACLQPDVCD